MTGVCPSQMGIESSPDWTRTINIRATEDVSRFPT
nr:MAG TPA: hypothetical protein [Caudoviricetes sp.]